MNSKLTVVLAVTIYNLVPISGSRVQTMIEELI